MKKLIFISLNFFLLVSGLHLALATLICGGEFAAAIKEVNVVKSFIPMFYLSTSFGIDIFTPFRFLTPNFYPLQ